MAELRLYPGFTPWVTKYADNGRARTDAELRAYFAEYRRRLGLTTWLRSALEQRAKDSVRARLSADSPVYQRARAGVRRAKGAAWTGSIGGSTGRPGDGAEELGEARRRAA